MNFPEFRPHPLIRGGHVQTLFTYVSPGVKAPEPSHRYEIELSDGDRVILHDNCPPGWKPCAPVVLLLHGLTGCFKSCYMQRCSRKMTDRSWRVFRLDHRGCGAGTGLADLPYHAGRTDDVADVFDRISKLCPGSPIYAIGFSLSGNILLKLAATRPDRLPERFAGLGALCPAIDLGRACENISRPENRRYDQFFVKRLWKQTLEYQGVQRKLPHVVNAGATPSTLREFDELVTAPLGGFESASEYYSQSSCRNDLHRLEHPALLIAAADDPLIPVDIYDGIELADDTKLIIAKSGGHLGFYSRRGSDPDTRWADWRFIDWIEHLHAKVRSSIAA